MVPRPLVPLLGLALLLLLVPLAHSQAKKCGGPCRCLQLPAEDPDEGFGVLVNCSGVPADAGGAVPVPSDAALEGGLRGAAFARMAFAGCGAERLLHLEAPAGVPLRALDLSANALTALLDRVLDGVRADLRVLRLDRNRLHELNGDALRPLRALHLLDVAHNALRELDLAALPPGLLRLRAADNAIAELHALPLNSAALELQELDLSGNALTSLEPRALSALAHLTSLRLAGNPLAELDAWTLDALPRLRLLDVSACGLRALSIQQHGTLAQLLAADNALPAASVARAVAALPALQLLHLAGNRLDAFPVADAHLSLQVLNVSNNSLASLPDPPPTLPSLEVLDVSGNALEALPPTLGAPALPALRRLHLDANAPLAHLQLKAPLPLLHELSASDLPQLRALSAGELEGLRAEALPKGGCAPKDGDDAPGLVLRLARNELLAQIDEEALDGVPVCELDVSDCALTELPEKALPWEELRVIDLQGNPLDCSCSRQWLMERIVRPLYDTNRRQLLYEVRELKFYSTDIFLSIYQFSVQHAGGAARAAPGALLRLGGRAVRRARDPAAAAGAGGGGPALQPVGRQGHADRAVRRGRHLPRHRHRRPHHAPPGAAAPPPPEPPRLRGRPRRRLLGPGGSHLSTRSFST